MDVTESIRQRRVRIPHHAIQSDTIIIRLLSTLHLLDQFGAHPPIYLTIRLPVTALEIAFPTFRISLPEHDIHQCLANAFALSLRQHCDDIIEVVAFGIIPQLPLCLCLAFFSDIVPRHRQPTMTSIPNIRSQLIHPKTTRGSLRREPSTPIRT